MLYVHSRKGCEDSGGPFEGKSKKSVSRLSRSSLKGGDPAAGSPTATLLRLHPSR